MVHVLEIQCRKRCQFSSTISVKILSRILADTDKIIWKFIWEGRGSILWKDRNPAEGISSPDVRAYSQ